MDATPVNGATKKQVVTYAAGLYKPEYMTATSVATKNVIKEPKVAMPPRLVR